MAVEERQLGRRRATCGPPCDASRRLDSVSDGPFASALTLIAFLVVPFKARADFASLLLFSNPLPGIGFGIERIYNPRLAMFLGRLDIAYRTVLTRENAVEDLHPRRFFYIPLLGF